MGAMSPNLTIGIFLLKTDKYLCSRSAAPKLALVPASRYSCDVKKSYMNVSAKVH